MDTKVKKAAVKFAACAGIALFIVVAIWADRPIDAWKMILFAASGATCCAIIWPSQDEGDALMDWLGVDDDQ